MNRNVSANATLDLAYTRARQADCLVFWVCDACAELRPVERDERGILRCMVCGESFLWAYRPEGPAPAAP